MQICKFVYMYIFLFLSQGNLRRCLTQQADVRVQLYEVRFCYSIHMACGCLRCDYYFNPVQLIKLVPQLILLPSLFQGLFHVLCRNPQLQQPILDMFNNQVNHNFVLLLLLLSSFNNGFAIINSVMLKMFFFFLYTALLIACKLAEFNEQQLLKRKVH